MKRELRFAPLSVIPISLAIASSLMLAGCGNDDGEAKSELFAQKHSLTTGSSGGRLHVYKVWGECATLSEETGADSKAIIAKRYKEQWKYYDSKLPTVDADEVHDEKTCLEQATGSGRDRP